MLLLGRPILDLHDIRRQGFDFGVLHHENVAEESFVKTPVFPTAADTAFGYDHVVLFGHPTQLDDRLDAALNLFVKSWLAGHAGRAWYPPFDVVSQAGQNGRAVARGEGVHKSLNRSFVLAHGFLGLLAFITRNARSDACAVPCRA